MRIRSLLIPAIFILSCGSVKKTPATETADSVRQAKGGMENGIPPCILKMIDSFKLAPKHEQPQKVVEYLYKGKKVYYVEKACCDFFNEVYDDQCNLLGSPDGGFTGKGDGKLPDFNEKKSREKLIWKADQ